MTTFRCHAHALAWLVGLALAGCGGADPGPGQVPGGTRGAQVAAAAGAADAPAGEAFVAFAGGALGEGVADWSWNLCNRQHIAAFGSLRVLQFNACRGGDWSTGGYLHLPAPLADAVALEFDVFLGLTAANTVQRVGMAFGSGTQGVRLAAVLPAPRPRAWNHVRVDLAVPLAGQPLQDLMWMNASGHPNIYLNNIVVRRRGGGDGEAMAVAIDAAAARRPISSLIYGVAAFDDVAPTLAALGTPLNRWGGNATSSYDWASDASGRGSDWYFESVPESDGGEAAKSVVERVAANRSAGAHSMVTVPMLSWVARLGPGRSKLASFSIARYGAQQDADWQWMPDAGNGRRPDGSAISGNDPRDAHRPSDAAYQQSFLGALMQRHGSAAAGGVRYYLLDNEPSLWHETHRDIHPQGAGMDEVFEAMRRTATMIRATDPSALIAGPEEWGWGGYLFSGRDLQAGNWAAPPDRSAHGGMDYVPWLLQQAYAHAQASGTRLLDVFSLHYYPQGGEYSNDISAAMQARRNRSTRSLWDPAYVDESWIADRVRLLPRMREWVQAYHPGLALGLTEYSWGADGHINGATAQADVLGILGREGADLATRWTAPGLDTPVAKVFQLYRNADSRGGGFGDVSVRASAPDPDVLAAFAALRTSDQALTVMVVNKHASLARPLTLALAHFGSGSGRVERWQLTAANRITVLPELTYAGAQVSDRVPAQSVTLYVIR